MRSSTRSPPELQEEGWQWAEVIPDYRYPAAHGLTPLAPEKRPLSADEAAEQEALANEYDALASDEPEDEAAAARLDAIERRLDELGESAVSWPDEVKAIAGAAIHIRHDGSIAVERGVARTEDLPQAVNDNDLPAPKSRPALPSSVVRHLTAHRTAALRAALTEQPEIALDAVIYTLALPVFFPASRVESCLRIRPERPFLGNAANDIRESAAMQRLEAQHAACMRKLPSAETFWSWLRVQPHDGSFCIKVRNATQSLGKGADQAAAREGRSPN